MDDDELLLVFDCKVHGRQEGRMVVVNLVGGKVRLRCRLCKRLAGNRYYARRYRNR